MPKPGLRDSMADCLNVQVLQDLSPFHKTGIDLVTKASRDLLVACIKNQPEIKKVFFNTFDAMPEVNLVDFTFFPIEQLAVTFVCQVIYKIKDKHGFHFTIDREAVEGLLDEIYGSLQWKKLGFQLYTLMYPEIVRNTELDVKLRDFMGSEGHIWAERLLSEITEPSWTKMMQQKIVKGLITEDEYNSQMNGLFVKLHLLDPQSVIPAYQFLLNQRALPAVNLELATRNYLGGPLDCTIIQQEVTAAENKTSTPVMASRLSLTSDLDVYYGVEVDEFIVTEGRNMGLWTGVRPDNSKIVKAKDKCFIM